MAVDREGAPVAVGDLIEVFGHPASGAEVVAVADKGVYAIWRGEQRFFRDADRSYTSLGRRA